MSLPRYSKYKDSGVPWLGEVPEDWEVKRTSLISDLIAGFAFPSEKFGFDPELGIPLVRGDNVTEGWLRWGEKGRYWPFELEYDARYLLEADDIVIQMDGSKVGKNWAFVTTRDLPALLVQRVTRVRVTGALPKFVYFLFSNEMFINYVDQAKTDPAVPHITMKNIGDYPVPLPASPEQEIIVKFLDKETGKIDSLVREQQRLIELLKEKRQAVISHAVTKGVNPNAPMKDSGIEWLGEIPRQWGLKRFGYISAVVRGASPRPAGDERYFDGDFMHWITVGDLTKDQQQYLTSTDSMLTQAGAEQSRVIPDGTLVLSNSGATLGVPKILALSGCANDGVLAFLNLECDASKQFLYYYLTSLTENLRDRVKQGSGQPNLNTDIVKALPVPWPGKDEQIEIAGYVAEENLKLDELTAEAVHVIDLLQERRTALISAAVTGKIDVRGLVEVSVA
jgi:type I restriction enzyme, S subunit